MSCTNVAFPSPALECHDIYRLSGWCYSPTRFILILVLLLSYCPPPNMPSLVYHHINMLILSSLCSCIIIFACACAASWRWRA